MQAYLDSDFSVTVGGDYAVVEEHLALLVVHDVAVVGVGGVVEVLVRHGDFNGSNDRGVE